MLKYYDGNSGDVQLGVYARLRINEPAKAQVMLADYGFKDATVGEGVYQLRSSANSSLTATPGSSGLTLNAVGSGKKTSSSAWIIMPAGTIPSPARKTACG